jgi:hypothetical protein
MYQLLRRETRRTAGIVLLVKPQHLLPGARNEQDVNGIDSEPEAQPHASFAAARARNSIFSLVSCHMPKHAVEVSSSTVQCVA